MFGIAYYYSIKYVHSNQYANFQHAQRKDGLLSPKCTACKKTWNTVSHNAMCLTRHSISSVTSELEIIIAAIFSIFILTHFIWFPKYLKKIFLRYIKCAKLHTHIVMRSFDNNLAYCFLKNYCCMTHTVSLILENSMYSVYCAVLSKQ